VKKRYTVDQGAISCRARYSIVSLEQTERRSAREVRIELAWASLVREKAVHSGSRSY
jgi:hypothetical protein